MQDFLFLFSFCVKKRRMRVRDEKKKKGGGGREGRESDGYSEKVGRYISFKIYMILI